MRYILIAFFITTQLGVFAQNNKEFRAVDKLNQAYYYINNMYVDEINEDEMVETAIVEMLMKLDPHSTYIPAKDLKRTEEPLKGNFEGVGIQFNIFMDTITVVTPISGGPSDQLGIQAGDKIVEIDDSVVAGNGITNRDVVKFLRGPKGTIVDVKIKRRGEKKLLPFSITRGKIPLYSVDAAYMIDKKTGYIKVNNFSATTIEEVDSCLDLLNSKGMKNLILDLSNNGGGYLHAAQGLADQFIPKNKELVYTIDNQENKQSLRSENKGKFEKGNLIVMVNESSASASEIVSGAIQDYDRGWIVGRRTFGKGFVQKPIPLGDGSMIRLTVARYYTPSGRCIQKPYNNGLEAYYMDQYNRYKSGELTGDTTFSYPDSLKFKTINKQRTVYGGGGIMPDTYVKMDTTWFTEYYGKVSRKGLVHKFSMGYTDKNRNNIQEKYPNFEAFNKSFTVDKTLEHEFLDYIEENKIEFIEDDYKKSRETFMIQIKAFIARNIYGNNAFYQVINEINDIYMQAVKKMNEGWEF